MKRHLIVIATIIIAIALSVRAYAHPGRTDGKGGHTNRSTGEYHYHHGYSEHDHYDMDGDGDIDCPYKFNDKTDHNTGGATSNKENSSDIDLDFDASDLPTIPVFDFPPVPEVEYNRTPKTSSNSGTKDGSSATLGGIASVVIVLGLWVVPIFFRRK